MDPQQIREAVEYLNLGPEALLVPITTDLENAYSYWLTVSQAAAEYATMLEQSEQVWWCGTQGITTAHTGSDKARAIANCRKENPNDSPHIKRYGCGWRLLTPTKGTT